MHPEFQFTMRIAECSSAMLQCVRGREEYKEVGGARCSVLSAGSAASAESPGAASDVSLRCLNRKRSRVRASGAVLRRRLIRICRVSSWRRADAGAVAACAVGMSPHDGVRAAQFGW